MPSNNPQGVTVQLATGPAERSECGNIYPQLPSPVYPQLPRPALKVAQVLQVESLGKQFGHFWHWGFVKDVNIENNTTKLPSVMHPNNTAFYFGIFKT